VRQRQRPQTQVRSGVRHGSQHELDRVNALHNEATVISSNKGNSMR
jgi:hypothetical protein